MSKKKIIIFVLITALLTIGVCSAYYTGYPITSIYKSEIKTRYFDVWIYDNDTSSWNYSYIRGDAYLATGLQVYEHASHSDSYNTLYSPYVITSTDYLEAWTNMRTEKGPIKVLAGYRNIPHNKKIGGATQSQHQAGIASDPAVPYGEENDWVLKAERDWGFVYAYSKTGAIHVDSRTTSIGFPTVRPADKNVYVFTMEDGMKYHDYDDIYESGYYSTVTDQTVVKSFQADHGLTADGIVGPMTWDKILSYDSCTDY